jgi:hypothetical protein
MYLRLLSNGKPLSDLRNKEIDALAAIMERNDIIASDFKDPEDPKKWSLVFSYEGKQMMAERSGQPEASFANSLTSLRKIGIVDDITLNPTFRIYPKDINELKFVFHVGG